MNLVKPVSCLATSPFAAVYYVQMLYIISATALFSYIRTSLLCAQLQRFFTLFTINKELKMFNFYEQHIILLELLIFVLLFMFSSCCAFFPFTSKCSPVNQRTWPPAIFTIIRQQAGRQQVYDVDIFIRFTFTEHLFLEGAKKNAT